MKNFNTVSEFFPEGYEPKENQLSFARSVLNYRKVGIEIEELEWSEEEDGFNGGITKKVKITQSKLFNGYILNQKELVERAKELYKYLGWSVKVVPVVFSLQVDEINLDWIKDKMEEFGIKRNDLIRQLAIDKSSLSSLFSGRVELSKRTKATFFYYFLTYELNRDLRESLS